MAKPKAKVKAKVKVKGETKVVAQRAREASALRTSSGAASHRSAPPDDSSAGGDIRSLLAVKSLTLKLGLDSDSSPAGNYRTERLNGTEFIVVPVIALVQGVIQGITAEQPELALAAEFGRFPSAWNGRPVTIDHPYVMASAYDDAADPSDVIRVSASASPEVLEAFQIGYIFNTQLTSDNRLSMEVWLDAEKMHNHSDQAQALLSKIRKGEQVEVSTGLFTGSEKESGEYNGEQYFSVWRGVVPDHLALLPGELVGACSITDGCGVYAYSSSRSAERFLVHTQTPHANCSCGGESMTKTQTSTPSRGANTKAHKKFDAFAFLTNAMPDGMMDHDARASVQDALDAAHPGQYPYLTGLTNTHAIYSVYDNSDSGSYNRITYQRGYDISDDTKKASLSDDMTKVRLTTQITPDEGEDDDNSAGAQSRNFLSSNTASASAPEGVSSMTPEQLAIHNKTIADQAVAAARAEDKRIADAAAETAKIAAQAAQDALKTHTTNTGPVTVEAYLAAAPEGIRDVLQQSVKMHASRKAELIASLKSNTRNKFTEAQLTAFDITTLENLAELAHVPSYAGVGAAGGDPLRQNAVTVDDRDSYFAPPPPVLGIVSNRQANTNTNTNGAAAAA